MIDSPRNRVAQRARYHGKSPEPRTTMAFCCPRQKLAALALVKALAAVCSYGIGPFGCARPGREPPAPVRASIAYRMPAIKSRAPQPVRLARAADGHLPDFLQRNAYFRASFFQLLSFRFQFRGSRWCTFSSAMFLLRAARRLDHPQPQSRLGLVSGLGDHFDDVAGMQLVAQRNHASVDLRAGATVPDLE